MAAKCKIRARFCGLYWSQGKPHHGKAFKIVAMNWYNTEVDGLDNPEPSFDIQFEDGEVFEASAEEIFEGWAEPDYPTPQ